MHARSSLLSLCALLAACAPRGSSTGDEPAHATAGVVDDTVAARRLFEANIASIHGRDRAAYLATYLQTASLARTGPTGTELGFAEWPARTDSTWPDTLVARNLRVVPIAPGVVYGSYHYRVTSGGSTTEGVSERVFVRTPAGWRIAMSSAFGLPDGSAPPPIALVGGTLVNPGAQPVADAVVIARGGRIACAGAAAACPVPPGVERVDIRGGYVGPGLVDAHVHYSQTGWVDGRPDALDVRATHPYDSVVGTLRARPERFHRAYLCSGVTSVYDVGGYTWTYDLAERTRSALDAPRVVAAGPLLSTVDHWVNLPTMRQFVHMRDDSTVRATVRAQRAAGASALKVWYLQQPEPARTRARALLDVAGEEARRVELPLIVHATQLQSAKEAVAAGARVLVHSVETEEVDDELITAMRRTGTILIPTLTVYEGYADIFAGRSPAARYPLDCVDAETRANLERSLPESVRGARAQRAASPAAEARTRRVAANMMRLHRAGIPLAMGTDAGNPGTAHGPSVFREMEAMQAAGMSARDVFASATVIAARAAGLDAETGTVMSGKRADLVVWDADPTADIVNARRIRMVVRNGASYGREELMPRERR